MNNTNTKRIEITNLQPNTLVRMFEKSFPHKNPDEEIILVIGRDTENKEIKACEIDDLFLYLLGDKAHTGITLAYEKYKYEFYELTEEQKNIASKSLQMAIDNFDRKILKICKEITPLVEENRYLGILKKNLRKKNT